MRSSNREDLVVFLFPFDMAPDVSLNRNVARALSTAFISFPHKRLFSGYYLFWGLSGDFITDLASERAFGIGFSCFLSVFDLVVLMLFLMFLLGFPFFFIPSLSAIRLAAKSSSRN